MNWNTIRGHKMNRLHKFLLVVIAVAVVGFQYSLVVYAQQLDRTRVIEGQAVNGTTGGADVSSVTVTLHIENSTKHEHFTSVTDPQGSFRFNDVVFDPNATYGVSVVYQGALYGHDIDLSGKPPYPIRLILYDADSSQDSISIASASVLFSQVDKPSQMLWAMEIIKVHNTTDKTYVPGPEPMRLLRFSLPTGAQDLAVDTDLIGADVLQVDLGFALTASVPPGEHEIMFAYQFPYSDGEEIFTKSLPFGADSVRVLAPPEVVRLSSEFLNGPKLVDIGGHLYQLLTATNLPRDSRISLNLSGLPQATFREKIDQNVQAVAWEYGVVVALGIMMVGLVSFVMFKGGRLRDSNPYTMEDIEDKRGRIVGMIADLDGFSNEKKDHDIRYKERRRSNLIAQLKNLKKRDSIS